MTEILANELSIFQSLMHKEKFNLRNPDLRKNDQENNKKNPLNILALNQQEAFGSFVTKNLENSSLAKNVQYAYIEKNIKNTYIDKNLKNPNKIKLEICNNTTKGGLFKTPIIFEKIESKKLEKDSEKILKKKI